MYIGPWFSKSGPLASHIDIAQELVRNADLTKSETQDCSENCVSTSLPGEGCTLKREKHCYSIKGVREWDRPFYSEGRAVERQMK